MHGAMPFAYGMQQVEQQPAEFDHHQDACKRGQYGYEHGEEEDAQRKLVHHDLAPDQVVGESFFMFGARTRAWVR